MTVFVSKDCHYSMVKSANQLGIGTNNIVKVDVDISGRMDPKALERSIQVSVRNGSKPFFVGATAGTTVRGCFDPIKEISKVCKKYNIWLHIDALQASQENFRCYHRVQMFHHHFYIQQVHSSFLTARFL